MPKEKVLKFPPGFLWGASTSAYQIEGGIVNDWSQWEKKNADRLAGRAKACWQDWQKKRFPEMFKQENYLCGQAAKSWELYKEDIACLKELNCNAYRLGIEWARIEPEQGKINMAAVKHYREMLQALKDNKIKTVLTLWHWTNPVWLIDQGGWENKKVRQYFLNYVKLIVQELGDLVDIWVTLNEPLMVIEHGYLDGKFPPNKKFNPSLFKVLKNFTTVHQEAYNLIHQKYPAAPVGVAMTTGAFTAGSKYNPIEWLMVKVANYFRNDWFLKKISKYYDYIGVNYYHHDRLLWHPPFRQNLNKKITDRGWEIYPEGIYQVLVNYKKYKKPIYIMENGIADEDDSQRPDFIKSHLYYIKKAIDQGVDVRGYFYWSLMDNFEWAEGYWPKFGLYAIDRKTCKRTARPSVKVYSEICKNNQVKVN